MPSSESCRVSLQDLDTETWEVSQGILQLLRKGGGLCTPLDLVEVLFTEEAIRLRSRLEICNQLITAGAQQSSEVGKLESKLERLREELALAEVEKLQRLSLDKQGTFEEYDLVVEVAALGQLVTQGWPISTPSQKVIGNSTNCSLRCDSLNNPTAIVAVVGPYHCGKTYLLNQLSRSSLPCSAVQPTKGLSFKQVLIDTDTPLTLLDTAGSHRPIKTLSERSVAEQEATEMFLLDIALDLSDYFLFVVKDWTTADQCYLQRIETHLANSAHRVFPEIIVVHNMKDVRSREELGFAWNREIAATLGQTQQSEVTVVHPKTGKLATETVTWVKTAGRRHICLVNDYCLLGKEVNPWALGLLKCWLKGIVVPVSQPQPLLAQLMSLMDQKLSEYYRKRMILEVRTEANGLSIITAQQGNPTPLLPTSNSISVIGTSPNLNPDAFTPAVDILKSATAFTVLLDLPGFSPCEVSLSRQSTVTTVSGRRKLLTSKECLRQERRKGEFLVSIIVPPEYEKHWSSTELCNGVLTIKYKRDTK